MYVFYNLYFYPQTTTASADSLPLNRHSPSTISRSTPPKAFAISSTLICSDGPCGMAENGCCTTTITTTTTIIKRHHGVVQLAKRSACNPTLKNKTRVKCFWNCARSSFMYKVKRKNRMKN